MRKRVGGALRVQEPGEGAADPSETDERELHRGPPGRVSLVIRP
jgi:hypothetical protein